MKQEKDSNEGNDVEKPENECAPVHRFVRQLCGVQVEVEQYQRPIMVDGGKQLGMHECMNLAFSSEADAVMFMQRSYRPNVSV